MQKNPWFEEDVIPELRNVVREIGLVAYYRSPEDDLREDPDAAEMPGISRCGFQELGNGRRSAGTLRGDGSDVADEFGRGRSLQPSRGGRGNDVALLGDGGEDRLSVSRTAWHRRRALNRRSKTFSPT